MNYLTPHLLNLPLLNVRANSPDLAKLEPTFLRYAFWGIIKLIFLYNSYILFFKGVFYLSQRPQRYKQGLNSRRVIS